MKNKNELYIFETVDGWVGASVDIPEDEQLAVLTVRTFTSKEVRDILHNGNMSIPNSILQNIKRKYG